jgi:hypothetical protein
MLAGDANADNMKVTIDCVRERVLDTKAEIARQLQEECRHWTNRTNRMTYEWHNKGVKRESA